MPVMRAAVVGHIEWMEFVPVEPVPRPGEIVHADESWEQAAGGGSVAAVQLSKLADSVDFFTALGSDEHAERAREELEARGVTVHATAVDAPQRSGFTFVDDSRRADDHDDRPQASPMRATTTRCRGTSSRAATPSTSAAGDADALLMARRARVLVATARELATLKQGSVGSTRWSRVGKTRPSATSPDSSIPIRDSS